MSALKKAFLCLAILLLGVPLCTGAQRPGFEKERDEAIKNLNKINDNDTARVNALLKVFASATYLKEWKTVMPYCEEALVLSRRLNYEKGLTGCYRYLGHYYKSASNRQMAQACFDSVIRIAGDREDKTLLEHKAVAQRWKGRIYHDQENYYMALQYYFDALPYFEQHISRTTYFIYSDISGIYMELNNLDKALEYGKKNITLAEKDTSKIMLLQAYLGFVNICLEKNDLPTASMYLDKAEPYIPQPNEILVNYAYYQRRGHIAFQQKKFAASYGYYLRAYHYSEMSGHYTHMCLSLHYLSQNAMELGNMADARKFAFHNLELAEQANSKSSRIDALLNVAAYYNKTGNSGKAAYDYLKQAMLLKDTLVSDKNLRQINSLEALYESDKKEKAIIQLQKEKALQMAAAKRNSLLNKIFFVSIIVLLLFGYLFYNLFRNRQQISNQKQTMQEQKIVQLEKDRKLTAIGAMLKGQEEERSRIAKDLHDGLGGLLSGTKLSLLNVRENILLNHENAVYFDRALSMLDNSIGDLRKVAHNLMPETLVKFGLPDALSDFCNSVKLFSNADVIYQQFGEPHPLSGTAEVFIYRIIQELVNNAVRHADARQIIVQLSMNSDKTRITVEDDGKGFDENCLARSKGAGMSNIRYRVEYFNGSLDIETAPGKGTSVNIELNI